MSILKSLKCPCGVILWQGMKQPDFCAIACPKCKRTLQVERPKPPPKPAPVKFTVPEGAVESPIMLDPVLLDPPNPVRMKA